MASFKSSKFYPVLGWILFFPAIFICQAIVRASLDWLIIKTLSFFLSAKNAWELMGKISVVDGGLVILVTIILFYLLSGLFKITSYICPKPKISVITFVTLIGFLFALRCLALITHDYSIKYPLTINCIVDVFMLIVLISILIGTDWGEKESFFKREISIEEYRQQYESLTREKAINKTIDLQSELKRKFTTQNDDQP